MAILSMTGCGRGEIQDEFGRVVIELASVNAKYLDINLRCPSVLGPMVEYQLRDAINSRIGRGRINVQVMLELISQKDRKPYIDINLAKAYQTELDGLLDQLELAGQVDLNTLIRQPGVLTLIGNELDPRLVQACLNCLVMALQELEASRIQEGEKLVKDIESRLSKIGKLAERVNTMLPQVLADAKKRLGERINELCQVSLDAMRLEQETAILAERLDITEELVRLEAHLGEFAKIMEKGGRIGRKLDFMVQELLREWNTLSNKSNNSQINHWAVEAKDELEKIREQVQNVE